MSRRPFGDPAIFSADKRTVVAQRWRGQAHFESGLGHDLPVLDAQALDEVVGTRFEAHRHLLQDARSERAIVLPAAITEGPEGRGCCLLRLVLDGQRVDSDYLAGGRIDAVLVLGRVSPAAIDPVPCDDGCLASVSDSGGRHRCLLSTARGEYTENATTDPLDDRMGSAGVDCSLDTSRRPIPSCNRLAATRMLQSRLCGSIAVIGWREQ